MLLDKNELLYAVKYLARYNDNDTFPKPFEYDFIENNFETLIDLLMNYEYIFKSTSRNFRYILLPKRTGGIRIFHQLDPLHAIWYFALVKKISSSIEDNRVLLKENVVFSHRLNKQGDQSNNIFNDSYSYTSFNERSLELLNTNNYKYVVFADISDFYMRIYHHDLKNCLKNIPHPNTEAIDAIMEIIEKLTNKETIGIPIGPVASHLLAEIVLNEIDQILLSQGIVFCRYCDDFRFFCKEYKEALQVLEYFAEELYINLKLTINYNKTSIYKCEKAIEKIAKEDIEYITYNPSDDELKEYLLSLLSDDDLGHIDLSNLSNDDIQIINNLDFSDELRNFKELKKISYIFSLITLVKDGTYTEVILNNIDNYMKFTKQICEYLKSLDNLTNKHYSLIKEKLFSILDSSLIASTKYRKMFFYNMMTSNKKMALDKGLLKRYNCSSDIEKREIIMIFYKLKNQEFFHSELKKINNYCNPWLRRALFYGAKCISQERRLFIRDKNPTMDEFEKIILRGN